MKKIFLFSSLLILPFIGCQKKSDVTQPPVQEQTQNGVTIINDVITFDPGQLHNQAMAAAENYTFNFHPMLRL